MKKHYLFAALCLSANIVLAEPWTAQRAVAEIGGEDAWRPFNHTMFTIEEAIMNYFGCPVEYVYGSIVPKPLVKGINNAAYNVEYPVRFFSSLFRAEGEAAWDETCRFLINSTVGIGGLFDPAQNWFGIIDSSSSFAGTFNAWGIGEGYPLIIPFVPFGNVRDDCGYVVDQAFDPKTYINIFFDTGIYIGWTYSLWPNYGAMLMDPWEDSIRYAADPYEMYRTALGVRSIFLRDLGPYHYATDYIAGTAPKHRGEPRAQLQKPEGLKGNWRDIEGFEPYSPALDTFRMQRFKPRRSDDFWWMRHSLWNGEFVRDVEDHDTYGFAQGSTNKVVFVVPGLGTDHRTDAALAMGELINDAGASVVICDSSFVAEYIKTTNEGVPPGYMPKDAERFEAFVTSLLKDLQAEGKIANDVEVSFVGWSMGGLMVSHLAARFVDNPPAFSLGECVALNPPVAYETIESVINGNLAFSSNWTKDEFVARFEDLVCRGQLWAKFHDKPVPDLTEAEAGYGVAFLLTSRIPCSIDEYFHEKVRSAYPELMIDTETYNANVGMKSVGDKLQGQHFSIIHTWDDPLETDDDRAWLDATFGEQITWFSAGGHCGMFYTPECQDEILTRLKLK